MFNTKKENDKVTWDKILSRNSDNKNSKDSIKNYLSKISSELDKISNEDLVETTNIKESEKLEDPRSESSFKKSETSNINSKIDTLRGNVESNEIILYKLNEDLKEVKKKIESLKNLQDMSKLSEEVREELQEVKKIESRIKLYSEKVEMIYSELRKNLIDFKTVILEFDEIKMFIKKNSDEISWIKSNLASRTTLDNSNLDTKKSPFTEDISNLKKMIEKIK